jgi:hypothetical protein
MGGPRRPLEVREMKKPKWKVGETVDFEFLGSKRQGVIVELTKNPQHIDRWIYKIKTDDGMLIPFVGVDDSEKFASIYTKEFLQKKSNKYLEDSEG